MVSPEKCSLEMGVSIRDADRQVLIRALPFFLEEGYDVIIHKHIPFFYISLNAKQGLVIYR